MKKKELALKLKQIFKKHKLSDNHSKICTDYLIKAELIYKIILILGNFNWLINIKVKIF